MKKPPITTLDASRIYSSIISEKYLSADVINLWEGAHAERIRIPGPGEQHLEAQVIVLPCVRRTPHDIPPTTPTKRKGTP
jgi:hypothetical protein